MNDAPDFGAWVRKAESDRLAMRKLADGEPVLWDHVCYHAQQFAEKMLKAYLVYRGVEPGKTHDLMALLSACRRQGAGLEGVDTDCRYLVGFASAVRYPGAMIEPTGDDGRRAQEAANHVAGAVRELLPHGNS